MDPCLTYPTVITHGNKNPTIYRWFSKTAVFFGDCPRIFPYKELLVWIVWLGSRLSGKVQRNCEFKSGPGEWWLHVSWCTHSDSRIHPEKSLSFGDDCYHPSIVILGRVYNWVTNVDIYVYHMIHGFRSYFGYMRLTINI